MPHLSKKKTVERRAVWVPGRCGMRVVAVRHGVV